MSHHVITPEMSRRASRARAQAQRSLEEGQRAFERMTDEEQARYRKMQKDLGAKMEAGLPAPTVEGD